MEQRQFREVDLCPPPQTPIDPSIGQHSRSDDWINRLMRYPGAAWMRVRIAYYRLLGARIRGRCWLRKIEIPRNPWDVEIDSAGLDRGVVLLTTGPRCESPRIVIGAGTYINRHTMIDAADKITIGANCMIGPQCYITDHDHGFAANNLVQQQELICQPVVIEDGAWLGAHVIVLKGVTIGPGAIIGAGAVVRSTIPANAIAVGVPARVIGYREPASFGNPGNTET